MEIPRAVIAFSEISFSFDKRVCGWRQVRRTSKQRGQAGRDRVQHGPGSLPRRDGSLRGVKGGDFGFPPFRQLSTHVAVPFSAKVREGFAITLEALFPLGNILLTSIDGLSEMVADFIGNVKFLINRQSQVLLRQPHFFLSERAAV